MFDFKFLNQQCVKFFMPHLIKPLILTSSPQQKLKLMLYIHIYENLCIQINGLIFDNCTIYLTMQSTGL